MLTNKIHLIPSPCLMSIFIPWLRVPFIKLFAQGYLPHTPPPSSDDFYLYLCLNIIGNPQTHCILNLPPEQRFFFEVYLLYSFSGFCQEIKRTILFFFFNKFIYFWLHWVFVAARRLSLVVASGGYFSLRCTDFSLQCLVLLQSTGSRRTGFSSCGTQAQ